MDSTHSFISLVNKEHYFSVLKKEEQQKHLSYLIKHCKKIWFLNELKVQSKIKIHKLINEFKYIILSRQSNLIISIPENHFYNLNDTQIVSFFKSTASWSHANKICLKIIIYGDKINSLIKPRLIELNQYISGISSINAINKNNITIILVSGAINMV